MLNFEFSGSDVLLAGGLCLVLLVALIVGLRWLLRRKQLVKQDTDDNNWLHKKTLLFDPLQHNTAFFQIGLIAALSFTILAFNWSQYEEGQVMTKAEWIDDEIEMTTPPRMATPPPPTPPPPVEIVAMPDEEILEDTIEFIDQNIDADAAIFIPEPEKKKPKKVDLKPQKVEEDDVDEIHIRVEKMPRFPGCDDKACTDQRVLSYVAKHLDYPAIARENGIEGTVYVGFVIDQSGKMTNIEIKRDIGGGCGNAALKALQKMQQEITFTPGYQGPRAVKVMFNMPVKFRLQ